MCLDLVLEHRQSLFLYQTFVCLFRRCAEWLAEGLMFSFVCSPCAESLAVPLRLLSPLSRFYLHFPVALIKEFILMTLKNMPFKNGCVFNCSNCRLALTVFVYNRVCDWYAMLDLTVNNCPAHASYNMVEAILHLSYSSRTVLDCLKGQRTWKHCSCSCCRLQVRSS